MANKSGIVTLNGRFKPGEVVRLVRVKDETVLRAEGSETVAEATVDKDGRVEFTEGVEVGARYLITGLIDGHPVEIRARGNEQGDDNPVLAQPAIGYEPRRFALGGGPVDPDLTEQSDEQKATPEPDQADEPEPAPKPKASPSPKSKSKE